MNAADFDPSSWLTQASEVRASTSVGAAKIEAVSLRGAKAGDKLSLDGLIYVVVEEPGIDVRKHSKEELKRKLEEWSARYPNTPSYGTPGKTHLLYRARPGVRYAARPAPAVDIKTGAGSYVVVTPALARQVDIYRDDDGEPWLEDAPDWLAEQGDGLPTGHDDGWPADLDLCAPLREPPNSIALGIASGTAAGLYGDGGTGKSTIATHASVCVATGRPFFGTPCERRRVLYLSCEDGEHVAVPKARRVCLYEGVDPASLNGWLRVIDLVGHDAVLWDQNGATAAFERLRTRIPAYGAELLVIDGIPDTYKGLEETSQIKSFINALIGLLPRARGAVLLIGHVNRQTARNPDTDHGYRGNAAWHNAVRTRWYLKPRKDGGVVLENQKRNYGPLRQPMNFDWNAQAQLFVGTVVDCPAQDDTSQRDEFEQGAILRALHAVTSEPDGFVPAARTGRRTSYHVLSERPEFPQTLKARDATRNTDLERFWTRIAKLRAMELIAVAVIAREAGHRRSGIVLTPKGLRAIEQ